MTTRQPSDRLFALQAVEALRNGVPTPSAVLALARRSDKVQGAFEDLLDALQREGRAPGVLMAGGFGTGKSHTLQHFEHLAIKEGFAVSRVVVSKETPLFDADKVFVAAARTGRLPDAADDLLFEAASKVDWAGSAGQALRNAEHLPDILRATLELFRQTEDNEVRRALADTWSGFRDIPLGELKRWLKAEHLGRTFSVRAVPRKQLTPHRWWLASQLLLAAGYRGWVVLLDEVELIARYPLRRRIESYAQLEAWLSGEGQPRGLATVAAVTDDFYSHCIQGERLDEGRLKTARKVDPVMRERARAGMTRLRQAMGLDRIANAEHQDMLRRLADLYAKAYGRPPTATPPSLDQRRDVRTLVRVSITTWDIERLYAEQVDLTASQAPNLELAEDQDLTTSADPDDPSV